jgi:formylglycine-generating enzyme
MKMFCTRVALALAILGAAVAPSQAGVVSFGSGANSFQMEFVTIGNPGNQPDTTGNPAIAGSVGYTYGIGKFEVSRAMVDVYNANSGVVWFTLDSMSGITGGTGANRPATGTSWNEAARFVNWLNTSTGNQAAYKFITSGVNDTIELWDVANDPLDYDASNLYRSKRAKYALPSYNEWYKAAYYNPTDSTYFEFPNGTNTAPAAVAGGTTGAVYGQSALQGPADVTNAGGLSPCGVMGLGGNVFEWEESSFDLANSYANSDRGVRGGAWDLNSNYLSSSARSVAGALGSDGPGLGFRVVVLSSSAPPAVPEPSMMVIGTLFGLGGLMAKRRMKK